MLHLSSLLYIKTILVYSCNSPPIALHHITDIWMVSMLPDHNRAPCFPKEALCVCKYTSSKKVNETRYKKTFSLHEKVSGI